MRRAAVVAGQRRSYMPLVIATLVAMPLGWMQFHMMALLIFSVGVTYFLARWLGAVASWRYARHAIGPPGPPLEPEVLPNDIDAPELRVSYVRVLSVHEDVRTMLAEGGDLCRRLQDLYQYCGELAQSAGRVAKLANGVHAYLGTINVSDIERENRRLEKRVKDARDAEARRTFEAAVNARTRQLHTYHQLLCLYERVSARMEVVVASLESAHALAVKLQALDDEEIAVAHSSVADQLEQLRDDEVIVEAALLEAVPA